MIKRGGPKILHPVFDAYTFEGATCPCPTSPCTHRSPISLCGRGGGAHLHENASHVTICVDIAIPAGESEKGSAIEKREGEAEDKWAAMIADYEKAKKIEETDEESDGGEAGSGAGGGIWLTLPGAQIWHQGGLK